MRETDQKDAEALTATRPAGQLGHAVTLPNGLRNGANKGMSSWRQLAGTTQMMESRWHHSTLPKAQRTARVVRFASRLRTCRCRAGTPRTAWNPCTPAHARDEYRLSGSNERMTVQPEARKRRQCSLRKATGWAEDHSKSKPRHSQKTRTAASTTPARETEGSQHGQTSPATQSRMKNVSVSSSLVDDRSWCTMLQRRRYTWMNGLGLGRSGTNKNS